MLALKICDGGRHDCHRFATCTDTGSGTYKCTCNQGYTGDGKSCTGLFISVNTFSYSYCLGSVIGSLKFYPEIVGIRNILYPNKIFGCRLKW